MSEQINSINLDANQTVFFARELERIKSGTYDVQYPQLKAMSLIPVSMEAGNGAESITYQQFDKLGMAKVIANYADDIPRADIKGKEFTSPIRSLAASYGYNVQEIRAAQFAGRNLQARKAEAARRAVEQEINNIAWYGNAENNLLGLVNNPNITRVAAPLNAGATSTLWANKTPDEILEDMYEVSHSIVELTNGVEIPNTLILPIAQYNIARRTRLSTASDTTIMEYFLANNGYITRIEWVNELVGAGLGVDAVAAGGDVMIAYDNNPMKLTLEVPQAFEQFPAQERNLEFVINCHSRIGGVIVYYPLSVAIMEGI